MITCQRRLCLEEAVYKFTAEGTSYEYVVCTSQVHQAWAKEQITQDCPGRRVIRDYTR